MATSSRDQHCRGPACVVGVPCWVTSFGCCTVRVQGARICNPLLQHELTGTANCIAAVARTSYEMKVKVKCWLKGACFVGRRRGGPSNWPALTIVRCRCGGHLSVCANVFALDGRKDDSLVISIVDHSSEIWWSSRGRGRGGWRLVTHIPSCRIRAPFPTWSPKEESQKEQIGEVGSGSWTWWPMVVMVVARLCPKGVVECRLEHHTSTCRIYLMGAMFAMLGRMIGPGMGARLRPVH